jgi:hypothetical protein
MRRDRQNIIDEERLTYMRMYKIDMRDEKTAEVVVSAIKRCLTSLDGCKECYKNMFPNNRHCLSSYLQYRGMTSQALFALGEGRPWQDAAREILLKLIGDPIYVDILLIEHTGKE